MLLLRPPPSSSDEGVNDVEIIITTGTAELFYDEIKHFTHNLLQLNFGHENPAQLGEEREEKGKREQARDKVKVSLIESVDWHHVFAFLNLPGELKAQVEDVVKTFMLA